MTLPEILTVIFTGIAAIFVLLTIWELWKWRRDIKRYTGR